VLLTGSVAALVRERTIAQAVPSLEIPDEAAVHHTAETAENDFQILL
jgi:hypothetical protein